MSEDNYTQTRNAVYAAKDDTTLPVPVTSTITDNYDPVPVDEQEALKCNKAYDTNRFKLSKVRTAVSNDTSDISNWIGWEI